MNETQERINSRITETEGISELEERVLKSTVA